MELVIRRATPADAAVIHGLILELARYEREPDAVKNTPEKLAEQMGQTHPPFQCLIAVLENKPVGFALYFFTYSTWEGTQTLYLEDLFVPEALRGQGVGFGLLNHLAREAISLGCRRMEWSVLNWNQLAIDVYERIGAEAQHEWTGYRLSGENLKALADH